MSCSEDDLEFVEWLKSNGALFPKIEWPALNDAGIKGGIAKETIEVSNFIIILSCAFLFC